METIYLDIHENCSSTKGTESVESDLNVYHNLLMCTASLLSYRAMACVMDAHNIANSM
jgi:hypothetical protein